MINDYKFDLFMCEEKIYLSYDSMNLSNSEIDVVYDIHTPELNNESRLMITKIRK